MANDTKALNIVVLLFAVIILLAILINLDLQQDDEGNVDVTAENDITINAIAPTPIGNKNTETQTAVKPLSKSPAQVPSPTQEHSSQRPSFNEYQAALKHEPVDIARFIQENIEKINNEEDTDGRSHFAIAKMLKSCRGTAKTIEQNAQEIATIEEQLLSVGLSNQHISEQTQSRLLRFEKCTQLREAIPHKDHFYYLNNAAQRGHTDALVETSLLPLPKGIDQKTRDNIKHARGQDLLKAREKCHPQAFRSLAYGINYKDNTARWALKENVDKKVFSYTHLKTYLDFYQKRTKDAQAVHVGDYKKLKDLEKAMSAEQLERAQKNSDALSADFCNDRN